MDDARRDDPLLSAPADMPAALNGLMARPAPRRFLSSLSARLLVLTIVFVMITEVVFFTPSVARYRLGFLDDKLATAHLVLTALDVAAQKTGQIDPQLRDNLLSQGRLLGMSVHRPNLPTRTFGPAIPARIPIAYDLRRETFGDNVLHVFETMFRRDTYAVIVTGVSPSNPAVLVEAVFDERPLRTELLGFAGRILAVSALISLLSAMLVYGTIQWLAVRPLRKLP